MPTNAAHLCPLFNGSDLSPSRESRRTRLRLQSRLLPPLQCPSIRHTHILEIPNPILIPFRQKPMMKHLQLREGQHRRDGVIRHLGGRHQTHERARSLQDRARGQERMPRVCRADVMRRISLEEPPNKIDRFSRVTGPVEHQYVRKFAKIYQGEMHSQC